MRLARFHHTSEFVGITKRDRRDHPSHLGKRKQVGSYLCTCIWGVRLARLERIGVAAEEVTGNSGRIRIRAADVARFREAAKNT